jgi:hypothetical protein
MIFAKAWLHKVLKHGEQELAGLLRMAEKEGFSRTTIAKALLSIRVRERRVGQGSTARVFVSLADRSQRK